MKLFLIEYTDPIREISLHSKIVAGYRISDFRRCDPPKDQNTGGSPNLSKLLKKMTFKVGHLTPELNARTLATSRSDFFTPKLEIQKSILQLTESAFLSCKEAT
jgi:hypothetical protein